MEAFGGLGAEETGALYDAELPDLAVRIRQLPCIICSIQGAVALPEHARRRAPFAGPASGLLYRGGHRRMAAR